MGKPDSDQNEGSIRKLVYFTGGMKTEFGIGFELEDGLLTRKNCRGKWEPE